MTNDSVKKISLTDAEKKAFLFLGDDVLGCFPETAVIIDDAKTMVFNILRRLEEYGFNDVPYTEISTIKAELRVLNGYLETNFNWVYQVSNDYKERHVLPLLDLYETLDPKE